MAATVKTKIRSGTIFLFILLLLCGGLGIYYVVLLKNDAHAILKNNYESLDYCHDMQQSLDSLLLDRPDALKTFAATLASQEKNETEPGEKEATRLIRQNFERVILKDTSSSALLLIRQQLQKILDLNMLAIEAKNQRAETTADKALTYLTLIVAFILIVGITFSYNFPTVVTDPIRELTEAIKQIGSKNYKYRIHLERKDEFGRMADAYNGMAERLEYFESSNLNKLMFEKTRAEAVINSLKDASIGIDKNEMILFANNQTLQLLGLTAEDITGKSVQEVSRRNDLFRFLVEEKGSAPFKIVLDNRENYFIKEIIEVPQGDGSDNKVIVLKNITTFKELDVAKTNFMATISHELKTPLAASDFGLKLLQDERTGTLSLEQKELVMHLKEDNQRMLKILSELLNMSQVESGRMEMKIEDVAAFSVIDRAVASVQSAVAEKEIRIEKRISPGLPLIKADSEKTGWVLNNFLINAIRYSPAHSTITVSASLQKGKLIFSVADEGSGIEEKYLLRVFDRYFRVPGSKMSTTGTGLGLAISKEFIEAMQGKIYAESTPGVGSVFRFELPIEVAR